MGTSTTTTTTTTIKLSSSTAPGTNHHRSTASSRASRCTTLLEYCTCPRLRGGTVIPVIAVGVMKERAVLPSPASARPIEEPAG